MRHLGLVVLLMNFKYSTGHQRLHEKIPNGSNVPHPCSAGTSDGLEHKLMDTKENPFIKDFITAGMEWNNEICTMDSDSDGTNNGEELGDPDCIWKLGDLPSRQKNISNPGLCEPMNATRCLDKNIWLRCTTDSQVDNCKFLEQKDILRKQLRLPVMNIPKKRTSYFCMIFSLPENGTFHLLGTKPIIDNQDATHHILLFGCDERESPIEPSTAPYPCGMLAHKHCFDIIGTWTVGSYGDCFHKDTGVQIGNSGFRRAALQIHWNNPSERSNMTDSSGIELFYTRSLRKYSAGMFVVGQEYLEIPPGIPEISFHSSCSNECTEVMFPDSIYITRAVNHMHHRGTRQTITLYRDNQKLRDITYDENYSYSQPFFYEFDPPIQIKPGDEIRTTCTFSSLTSNKTTRYGEGTSDEMCYGFISYYPVQRIELPYCTTWKTVEKCKRYLPQFGGIINGCNWREFLSGRNQVIGLMLVELALHCDMVCSSNCTEKVRDFRKHACLRGDLGDFMINKLKEKYASIRLLKDCFEQKSGSLYLRLTVTNVYICLLIVLILL